MRINSQNEIQRKTRWLEWTHQLLARATSSLTLNEMSKKMFNKSKNVTKNLTYLLSIMQVSEYMIYYILLSSGLQCLFLCIVKCLQNRHRQKNVMLSNKLKDYMLLWGLRQFFKTIDSYSHLNPLGIKAKI